MHAAMMKQNEGLYLVRCALPLSTTQLSDLAICPLRFQRAVRNIRTILVRSTSRSFLP